MHVRASVVLLFLALNSSAQERTAGLTGTVRDPTGAAIPGVDVTLRSDESAEVLLRTTTNSHGKYHLSGLAAGAYTLRLLSPGFKSLTVRSVQIPASARQTIPVLELEVADLADCGGHPVLDSIRLLPSQSEPGTVGGSVAALTRKMPPPSGARVTLRDSTGRTHETTLSGPNGEFVFTRVPAGRYSLRVARPGFYPLDMPGYKIRDGIACFYFPLLIEPCPRGDCDPRRRPKRPPLPCQ